MRSAVLRLAKGPWPEPAGVALVLVLVVAGSVAEAYPSHHYAGLHLRTHPNPAAFAVVAVPALLLWWRRSHPAAVYLAAVAATAGWAAMGQVYGASLVVVLVALYWLAVAGSGRIALAALGTGGALTIWLVGGLLGPWGWWGVRNSTCGPRCSQPEPSAPRSRLDGNGRRASVCGMRN